MTQCPEETPSSMNAAILTGQPFRFDNALPPGFVYDTEPPSRAVVTIGGIEPTLIFPLFRAIQNAFYAEGRDSPRPACAASPR